MDKVELNIAPLFCPGFEKTQVQLTERCTIYEFLEQWSDKHAPGFISQVFNPDTRSLREGVLILINGKAVQQPVVHESLIAPGDVISIMPIIIGG